MKAWRVLKEYFKFSTAWSSDHDLTGHSAGIVRYLKRIGYKGVRDGRGVIVYVPIDAAVRHNRPDVRA